MIEFDLEAFVREGTRARSRPAAAQSREPNWSLRADASSAPAHLYLYDAIGWPGIEPRDIVEHLRAHATRPLLVHLNSPGGDVFDGLAVYNALRQHGAPVDIRVEGLAASIASIIAMAGSTLRMARASMLMIHEPRALVIGDAHDMRAMATLMDKATGLFADIYTKRGADRDKVRAWMHAETWWTAREALDAGLIDAVDDDPVPAEAVQARAHFDLSGFRHVPGRAPAPPADPVSVPSSPRARERARLLATGFDHLVGASCAPEGAIKR